ncbi:MAG: outer membrane lipoprotein-sorting protein [Betaproteobacteria bacterium]|nr:outer membrane lipoprotein-sorting protein [Betaproteobacteria bacterium]
MTIRALFASLLVVAAATCQAAPDAQRILVASDAVRNPGRPFSVTVALTEFQGGRRVDASTMVTYSRTLAQSAQFATLVRFTAPARDTGKLMLKNGQDLWFYDPSTKASVRLSPQQRLLGQASNGDVVTVNLARDYKAALAAEEEIQDGDRKMRRTYKLELTAAVDEATYSRIELWVGADNNWPLKGRFFADSGSLLKTVYYRRFAPEMGIERPTELVIIDGINPASVTLMRLSEYTAKDIPGSWFQRDYLPRFQPE